MIKGLVKPIVALWLICFMHIVVLAEIPAGYYHFAENKKQAALKTALHELAYPQKVLKYGSGPGRMWEGFYQTDRNPDNSVVDMYSDIVRYFNGDQSVTGMHIEHSLPQSWWGGHKWFVHTDLFHLYPSDGSTNMSKSNNPLGVVIGTPTKDNGVSKIGPGSYTGYTGNVFEPADEFKGDFARSYFYVSTIYEDLAPYWNSPMMSNNTYPVWTPWAIQLLMEWHEQDPVSIKEVARQEAVYTIQGNRNPFIDYPDLVNYIWGADTVNVYPFDVVSQAYLISPKSTDIVDFGVLLQEDSLHKSLVVRGANIASDLTLSLKINHSGFSFSPQVLAAADVANGINIALYFHPLIFGTYVDTLVIDGGGLSQPTFIPLVGHSTKDFMVLDADEVSPVGARLNWIADPHATSYRLKVYQGALKAGNIMISSYVEGSSYNKAIEIYNGTGKTIDLSNYTLQKQSNGVGPFEDVLQLNGWLNDKQTYLIANTQSASTLKSQAQLVTDLALNFNGNDAVGLYQNGILVDIVGYADAGLSVMWGEDKTLSRKSSVTHPSTAYDEAEWDSYAIDYFTGLGTHSIQFQTQENILTDLMLPDSAAYYYISGLVPENSYNYYVEAIDAGVASPSSNTMQFNTSPLSAPEVTAATGVTNTQFTANWESDLYTNNYLVDVFQLVGAADATETEAFDAVGTSGKPLPAGWTGTASGGYSTPGSSGVSPPSISLQKTGEWLQTKVYSPPIKTCSFMYKWASAGTGSHFIVEALKGEAFVRIDSIAYTNLAKVILNYLFSSEEHISAIKITYGYKKGTGNLAFDDFTVTYGSQDTVNLLTDLPVSNHKLLVENLAPETEYYYNVRAVLLGSTSPVSENVHVTTLLGSGTMDTPTSSIKIKNTPHSIHLSGLSAGDLVKLYTITGIMLFQALVEGDSITIPFSHQGLYIINVQHQGTSFSTKILR